jgi:hypothetical protein
MLVVTTCKDNRREEGREERKMREGNLRTSGEWILLAMEMEEYDA